MMTFRFLQSARQADRSAAISGASRALEGCALDEECEYRRDVIVSTSHRARPETSSGSPRLSRISVVVLVGVVLVALLQLPAHAIEPAIGAPAALIQQVAKDHGDYASRRLEAWNRVLQESRAVSEPERLEAVNRFFNQMLFKSDQEQWGLVDYWATPQEFLIYNGGDCEDFALAKYFTLAAVGVPVERMRLTYVHALELDQAHMVLTYYTHEGAEPLVLDNLIGEILPASQRRDLAPVYSFNADGLWLAKQRGLGERVAGADRLSRWRDLMQRMTPTSIE